MNTIQKIVRFMWRLSRNVISINDAGRQWLFPQDKLSKRFGRDDSQYAWQVFLGHIKKLNKAGFRGARQILEVGPGRNLGTALLLWCYFQKHFGFPVKVVCWDVFKNACPEENQFWQTLAGDLINAAEQLDRKVRENIISEALSTLRSITRDKLLPDIEYQVAPLEELIKKKEAFDLIYSQAVIEHIWNVDKFWDTMALLTAQNGWHSHRIDLADHGRRETNYIEMLQWSEWSYNITQRYIPGALNRWRANDHLEKLQTLGFEILSEQRELRDKLPIPRSKIVWPFRNYDEDELRCTALDVIAVKPKENKNQCQY